MRIKCINGILKNKYGFLGENDMIVYNYIMFYLERFVYL